MADSQGQSSEASGDIAKSLSPEHKQLRMTIFIVTWMSYAGYYFCRKTFSIVKVDLRDLMGVTDSEIAHIWTAFLVSYMLGQFVTAYLGRKYACRTLLLAGMAISAAANVAFGVFPQWGHSAYWPFFFFMIVNGLAQGTGWGGNIGLLAHWFRRSERGTALAFWATCYMLGSVAAKVFAAFMLGWLGLSWSFWGASIVLFVVWIVFYLTVRDRPEDYGLKPILSERLAVEEGSGDKRGRKLVKLGWTPQVRRTILVMGVAYFCFKFVRYALDSWTPMLLEESFGTSTVQAGYSSAIFDFAGFFGVIFAGLATDKKFKGSRVAVTFFMTVGMLLGVLFMWRWGTHGIGAFLVGIGLIGFMLAGPDSLLSGVGSVDVASKRGAVVAAAVINGIGSFGSVVQEEIIGVIKTSAATPEAGLRGILILLCVVAVFGVLTTSVLVYWRRVGKTNL